MTWLHVIDGMRSLFLDNLPGLCMGLAVGLLAGIALGGKLERLNRPTPLRGRWTKDGYYPES